MICELMFSNLYMSTEVFVLSKEKGYITLRWQERFFKVKRCFYESNERSELQKVFRSQI